MYENAEPWDKDVPPDLIPAIKHLRHSFDRAQWAFGWTTQKLCWSCFHGNLDEEDVKSHIKTLGRLKQEAGPVPTQRLAELLEVGTPSAVFKAFFNFYLEGVSKQALNIKKETGEVRPCSPTYTNQALRTLKAMLGKAEEWNVITRRPKIIAVKTSSRDRLVDTGSEQKLRQAHQQPMKNRRVRHLREQAWMFFVILQDTGMRPDELFPMRIENVSLERKPDLDSRGKD